MFLNFEQKFHKGRTLLIQSPCIGDCSLFINAQQQYGPKNLFEMSTENILFNELFYRLKKITLERKLFYLRKNVLKNCQTFLFHMQFDEFCNGQRAQKMTS